MFKKAKVIIVLIFVMIGLIIGMRQISPPGEKTGSEKQVGFSMEKTIYHINVIAQKPHPTNSEQNFRVRDYIVNELKNIGLSVELHKKLISKNGKEIPVENIFAMIKGESTDSKKIMLIAHYDSTAYGPGAGDDGVGVAVILETVRELKERSPLKNDIFVLITDGEELGLLGAKAFAEDKINIVKNLDFIINLEARGNKGAVVLFETSNNNYGILKAFSKVCRDPIAFSFSQDVYSRMANDTDFSVFKKLNVPGINLAIFDGYDTYHNELDTVENLSRNSLLHYGQIVSQMAEYLADADTDEIIIQDNAIYFPLLNGNMIVYSSELVIPFAILILCLLIAIITLGFRKGILTFKKLIKSSLICMGTIIFLVLLSIPLVKLVFYAHEVQAKGFNVKGFEYSDTYFILITVVCSCIVFSLYYWLSRKENIIILIYGTIIIWTILLLVSSIYFPGFSYIFTWPLLVNSLLAGYICLRGLDKIKIIEIICFSAVFSFTNILIYLPVIYMVYVAMTIGIMPALVFLLALPLIYIISFTIAVLKSGNQYKNISMDMSSVKTFYEY